MPRWALVLASLIIAPGAFALDASKHLTQYILTAWQAEQGLPQNTVLSIARTPDGYLWLGTQEGVARFNGVKFTVFNRINTPELRGVSAYALMADSQGRLWIGTDDGLILYQHGRFKRIRDGVIRAIAQDHLGALWIASADGLERIEGDLSRSRVYTVADGLGDRNVQVVYEDRERTLWVSTQRGGLQRLRAGRWVSVSLDSDRSSAMVSAIAEDERGALWMGTRDGRLYRVVAGQTGPLDLKGLEGQPIRALLPDTDGILLIATLGGGLRRLQGDSVEQLTTEGGLPSDNLRALYKDPEGSIWIGTSSGGLVQLRDGKFTPFGVQEGLIGRSAWSIAELRNGSLLVGTDRGLSRFQDDRFQYLSGRYGLGTNTVRAILESRDGDIWIGVDTRGVYRLRGEQITHYRPSDGVEEPTDRVFALFEDSRGRIWVGTQNKLYHVEGDELVPEKAVEPVGAAGYGLIAEDRSGRIVLATDSRGVLMLDGGKLLRYGKVEGMPSLTTVALQMDDRGAAWAGTAAGLARIYDGRVTTRILPGPLQQEILGIFEDRQHQFWLTTNKGLFSVSRYEVEAYFSGTGGVPEIRSYGVPDGMRASEFNGGNTSAGCLTRKGDLWLVTIRGLVRVNPTNIPVNRAPPAVLIEHLIGDGKPLELDGRLEVPPGVEKWEFQYAALSFRASERQRFRYKLDGYDRNWVEAGERRSAYYTRIPPGKYTFQVVASNDDGIWNLQGASLKFRLRPHVYETALFYALCAVAVAALIVTGHRARVRHMRSRAAQLEALVAQRTADLAKAREDLLDASREAGRAEIAASVLHNVGNALNSLNVSANLLSESVKQSRLPGLTRLAGLLQQQGVAAFAQSERGRHLPEYLAQLSQRLDEEQRLACSEIETLQGHIGHLGEIVSMQEAYVNRTPFAQTVMLVALADQALAVAAESVERNAITVIRDFQETGPVVTDKHRVTQILMSLIRNAVQACADSKAVQKQLKVKIERVAQGVAVCVTDNGVGIASDDLTRIFSHGSPTSSSGRGFGLHGAALAAREIGGSLAVHSDGSGRGATFTLVVPRPLENASQVA